MRLIESKKVKRYLKAQSSLLSWMGAKPFRPFGWYVPYSYRSMIPAFDECSRYEWLFDRMSVESENYLQWLERLKKYSGLFESWCHEDPNNVHRPRFNQSWFTGLDGAMAYTMVQHFQPSRIIEIGSGHSTRFLAQAIKDLKSDTHLLSIDPQPRREIDKICSQVIRQSVTEAPIRLFEELGEGDILFFDGSHVGMPGTDVDYVINQVFPLLAKGVVIHIHDIFLPHGYPVDWEWRSYNEQNFLISLLGGGNSYQILCPNAFMSRYYNEEVKACRIPKKKGSPQSSFWIQKQV